MKTQYGKNKNRADLFTYLGVIAAFAVMSLLSVSGSLSRSLSGQLIPICCYMSMAVSLNLTVGILGELSLGHAGFMCLGAFFSAMFSKIMVGSMPDGLRFFAALLIGALIAGVFGILIGIPVLRLNGDYLAIVTLAFGEIIKNLMNVFYVGKDSSGIHIAMQDAPKLNMAADASDRSVRFSVREREITH